MQRRQFLKLCGAASLAGTLPFSLNAKASAQKRVIVIGAGYAGATVAKYLRLWGADQIEVVLIEKNTSFISCPLSNLVLGGSRSIGQLTFNYAGLDRGHFLLQMSAFLNGLRASTVMHHHAKGLTLPEI